MSAVRTRAERFLARWRPWLCCWALLWGARLAVAWAVSRPLSVAASAGAHADRGSFEPGGLMLLEVLRLRAEPLLQALPASASLLVGAWALLVVVTTSGVALLDRDDEGPGTSHWLAATARALPRVLVLAALAAGLSLLCLVVLLFGTAAVRSALTPGSSPIAGDLVVVGAVLPGLVLLALLGMGFDLARVHLLRGAPGLRAALRGASLSFRRHGGGLIAQRAAIATASLLVVGGVAWLVRRQDLAQDAPGPLVVVFVLHRLAGGLLAGIQVAWLALVLRACDACREQERPSSLPQP